VERSEAEAIYTAGREPVVGVLLALSARLEAQDAQLAALVERVEELERRLKRDSSNSSLPPSDDPPWLGKRGRSRGTGRTRGGQPGHVGHGRGLFPIERVSDVVDHWPARCACGHVFGEQERESAGAAGAAPGGGAARRSSRSRTGRSCSALASSSASETE